MRVRFDPSRRLIVLPVRVTGPSSSALARLALDTGATTTILSSAILGVIGAMSDTPATRRELVTASGSARYPEAQIPRIEALGKSVIDLRVSCLDLPVELQMDGLLGMDFLAGSILTIDFQQGFVDLL